jgi:hypothetical protein
LFGAHPIILALGFASKLGKATKKHKKHKYFDCFSCAFGASLWLCKY